MGKAAGWGTLYENGRPSCVLRHVDVPIVGHAQCADTNYVGGLITENMVCAGHETGGKDSCQGDSGGPLMRLVPGGGGDKRFEIIGNGARKTPRIAPETGMRLGAEFPRRGRKRVVSSPRRIRDKTRFL